MSTPSGGKEPTRACPVCRETIPAAAIVCHNCGAFLHGINKGTTREPVENIHQDDKKSRIFQAFEESCNGAEDADVHHPHGEVNEEEYACPECGNQVDLSTSKCPGCGVNFSDFEELPDKLMETAFGQLEQILEQTASDLEIDATQYKDFHTDSFIEENAGEALADLDALEDLEGEDDRYKCPLCMSGVSIGDKYCANCGMILTLDKKVKRSDIALFIRTIYGLVVEAQTLGEDKLKNLQLLDDEIAKDIMNVKLWFQRGLLLAEMEYHGKALRSFDTVLRLDPEHKKVWIARAYLLGKLGKTKEAFACYARAFEAMIGGPIGTLKTQGIQVDKHIQGKKLMTALGIPHGAESKKIGLPEGLTNGRTNGITNGLRNGLTNGITNGLSNGLRALRIGLTNGITNGNGLTNGLGARQGITETKLSKLKVAAVPIIIVILVISPYLLFSFTTHERGVEIDGRFGDWSSVQTTSDTAEVSPFNPDIDIIDYHVEDKQVALSFYLGVSGQIFTGEPQGQSHVDTVHIFIDMDQDPESGYYIKGIGADYMAEIYGWGNEILSSSLSSFTSDTQDWNMWERIGDITSANSASELEVQIPYGALYKRNSDPVDVLFHTQSWDGFEDFSDAVISTEKGILSVKQEGIGQDVVEGNDNRMLRLILSAINADITVNELRISRLGEGPDSDIKAIRLEDVNNNPIAFGSIYDNTATFRSELLLSETENSVINMVVDIADSAVAENSIGFRIQNPHDVITDTGTINLEYTNSNSTNNDVCYIKRVPDNIVVDGAFADWNNDDMIDDVAGDVENPNLDILRYGVRNDTGMAWFYMRVDGEMAGGIHIPHWNDAVKTEAFEPGDGYLQPQTRPPRELAPKTGEDYAYIFVDSLQGSGYMSSNGPMRADFMVLIRGRHNEITQGSYYAWTGKNPRDWSWKEEGKILAEIDTTQLETGIELYKLGIGQGNHNVTVYFQTSDWENKTADVSDNAVNKKLDSPIRGTRSPPYGGWPSIWTSLGTDPNDGGIEDNDDILEVFANDSVEILYLRMDIESLSVEPKDCYDFYFNSSDTVWYRLRLYRNPQNTVWIFDLDNTTSSAPPTDSSTWWNEETNTINADHYDGANYGYNFNNNNSEGITNSVLVWVRKESLSQGYDLLEAGNTTYIFADTHDNGNTQNKQMDRAPDDTADPDPVYSYSPVGVFEFYDAIVPILGFISIIIIFRRRREKGLVQGCNQTKITEERK